MQIYYLKFKGIFKFIGVYKVIFNVLLIKHQSCVYQTIININDS